ncbi:MAG TPA: DUF3098 domain-containing protein [Bacteroidetes bacterium]|nr:DUF3098 domain-containing protein [Bacteroidota bacterium]
MQIPFKKNNIFIILAGLALIAIGYLLMSTENFIDATEFSLSLYVCPPLIVLGHVVIAVGIVYRKKGEGVALADTGSDSTAKG